MQERLQKYLARCGVASRRRSEEMIQSGAVTIDGIAVRVLGTKVDPERQEVRVAGQRVRAPRLSYLALYKPRGVVCAEDSSGRPRVKDLVPPMEPRTFLVGSLDADSEGLLILTNDGELAERATHPRFEVVKVYRVEVQGNLAESTLHKLSTGVWQADSKTAAARVQVSRSTERSTVLLITLKEDRNRDLRRALHRLNLSVKELRRIRIGPVGIGTLKRGQHRRLDPAEITALRSGRSHPEGSRPGGRGPGKSLRPGIPRPGREHRPAPGVSKRRDPSRAHTPK